MGNHRAAASLSAHSQLYVPRIAGWGINLAGPAPAFVWRVRVGPNTDSLALVLSPNGHGQAIGKELDLGLERIGWTQFGLFGQTPAFFGSVKIAPDSVCVPVPLFPNGNRVAFAVAGQSGSVGTPEHRFYAFWGTPRSVRRLMTGPQAILSKNFVRESFF